MKEDNSRDFDGESSIKKTIINYQSILLKMGFNIEMRWSAIGTYYSVEVFDKRFKTFIYGKGMTREEAAVSGLGEFIERVAFGVLLGYPFFWYSLTDKHDETIVFHDKEESLFYIKKSECFSKFRSTGMATGNTLSEARVHAFSEIIERYALAHFIEEPEEFGFYDVKTLKGFEEFHDIVELAEKNTEYKFYVINAYSRLQLPVIGVLLVDNRSDKYVFRFGAHPVLEQAIKSIISELFQFMSINKIFDEYGILIHGEKDLSISNKASLLLENKGVNPFDMNNNVVIDEIDLTCFIESTVMRNSEELELYYEVLMKKKHWLAYYRDVYFDGAVATQVVIPGVSDLYSFMEPIFNRKVRLSKAVAKYWKNRDDIELCSSVIGCVLDFGSEWMREDFYHLFGVYSSESPTSLTNPIKMMLGYDFVRDEKDDIYIRKESWEKNDNNKGLVDYIVMHMFPIDKNGNYSIQFNQEKAIKENVSLLNI